MKNYISKIIIIFCMVLLFISCREDKKPMAIIDDKTETAEDFKIDKDTTKVKVLALPVYIDSTNYIYHPTQLIYKSIDSSSSRFSKSSYDDDDKRINNYYSQYQFTGRHAAFAVENINSGEIINLTDQEISFSQVRIYNKLEYNPRVEFVLYEGQNLDTNKDKKLNYQDLSGLFISNIDGSGFTKLTQDFEQYLSYKFMVVNDKLYFQTIKDNNNDGLYENDDEYRNYVVDLTKADKKAIRYDENTVLNGNGK